jgi:hypothetical protein
VSNAIPKLAAFVESHSCAENAQEWGTRPDSVLKRAVAGFFRELYT